MILLDTHVLLWMDADHPQLGPRSRALIEAAWRSGRLAVSAISFWEVALLAALGRIVLPAPASAWRGNLLTAGLVELPLDGGTGIQAVELAGLHKDPADRFIAATALQLDATLLTADPRLLDWDHPLARHDARL